MNMNNQLAPTNLGITDVDLWLPDKKLGLFFDKIVVGSLDTGLPKVQDLAVRADWEYLANQGFVVEYGYKINGREGLLLLEGEPVGEVNLDDPLGRAVEEPAAVVGLAALYASRQHDRPANEAELLLLASQLNIGSAINRIAIIERSVTLLTSLHERAGGHVTMDDVFTYSEVPISTATARASAARFDALEGFTAVPIIPQPKEQNYLLPDTRITDVAQLILQSLPVPDDVTPWETILDFRRDEKTREQLARFTRWSRDAVRRLIEEDVSFEKLKDEYAGMTDDYRQHMKVHKLKYKTSIVETIVTLGAEFAENLLKLKFKDLAETFFQVRHNRIALMEAELKAPGREIAYVVTAQERFGPR